MVLLTLCCVRAGIGRSRFLTRYARSSFTWLPFPRWLQAILLNQFLDQVPLPAACEAQLCILCHHYMCQNASMPAQSAPAAGLQQYMQPAISNQCSFAVLTQLVGLLVS